MTAPGRLYTAGGVLLAVMPLAMVLANRSSPVVIGLAALAFLSGRMLEDRAGVGRRLLAPLTSAPAVAALAFLGWSLVSLAWSPFPAASLRVAGEFLPTLAAAYLLACLAPGRIPAFAPRLGAVAVALAGLLIAIDLAADLVLERALGHRAAAFVHNRPALTLDLVAGPLALVLWRERARGLAAVTLVFAALGVLRSISGAAQLGLLAGGAMFAAGRLLPRRTGIGLAGLGLGLAVALAPVEGDLLARTMPEAAHERLVQSSSRARVAIARSFGAAVAADPWRGTGYGTSARFAETPVAQTLPPEMRVLLGVGHPHNSFLQVWAELGLPGAFLAALTLMLSLARIARLDQPDRATALGLVACAAAIAFVEHNGWAAWWTAGLGAAITWMRAAPGPGAILTSDGDDLP
ncbi:MULTISPECIES: O-antigen ligase family protein [unclassified Methylobacterium]|jgi:O-antigen ligase|uniref:O-antigen ligase family protein n=1 Tax=unclassified Methylobacterium TaxID=2615210 RepID=UPI001353D972|nr:O-antigen ligase family protein [Methylobacterium sp. 2A]MWV24128.1 O-antigen ligase family protein [Methylobacterium sp. 2A]